jgi:hypothetical protein
MGYQVLGVKRIEGPKKDGSGPFEMNQLFVRVPIEVGSGKVKVTGYGFEVGTMEIEATVIPKMATVQFPAELELETEQKFIFGDFRAVVVGYRVPTKGSKAI